MRTAPALLALAALLAIAPAAGAEELAGLTTSGSIVRFDSATPGTIIGSAAITGLQPGEQLVAIDTRPLTGGLYGVGSTGRLYTIDALTGAATAVSSAPFTSLTGSSYGMDFNPVVDRIRLVSDNDQNLRVHPDTGALAAVDTTLTPAGGAVTALAYSNNNPGATTTTVFAIGTIGDQLFTIPNPNGGVLQPVGALGQNTSPNAGLDVSRSGVAFAVLQAGGAGSGLYAVNLTTGAATLTGAVGGGSVLSDVTAVDRSREAGVAGPALAVAESAGSLPVTIYRSGPTTGGFTAQYATADGTATTGADYTAATGTATIAAGQASTTIAVPIANDTAAEAPETLTLTISGATAGTALTATTVAITILDDDPPADTTAPVVLLAALSGTPRAVAARGLTLVLGCSEVCGGQVVAKVGKTVIASRSLTLPGAITTRLRIALTPAGRKLLKKARRAKVVVTASFSDGAGNGRIATDTVNLRR